VKTAALLFALCSTLPAATLGQIDTFQDGTTDNWFAGGGPFGQVPPIPPANIPDGGPAGAGDAFLQITAGGGSGPGSRLVALNGTQWAGSFAGIGGITADLINLGNSDLTIRLLLENPIPGPPTLEAVTQGVFLPVGGGWTHAFFSLDPSTLTMLIGSDPAALLGGTTVLRIIHGPAGDAEPVAGILGVDNIQAVPEPATLSMLAVACAAFAGIRRRRA
jgi:hypothetical protein